MDWQTSEDTVPSAPITEADARLLLGRPPATGAWRDGDPVGDRHFAAFGAFRTEGGHELPGVRLAYETWGELSPARDNAVLVLHALTGDSHVRGRRGPGHADRRLVGRHRRARARDRHRPVVRGRPEHAGRLPGHRPARPASPPTATSGPRRFPYLTVRDQVAAQVRLADALGIDRWAAVVGGSMGGMHALEWAVAQPERVERRRHPLGPAGRTPPTRSRSTPCSSRRSTSIRDSAAASTTTPATATARTAASRSRGAWRC